MHLEANHIVFGSDEFAPPKKGQTINLPLKFTGSGAEYFRIWIVNVLLTIVSFGIYSAWAKVRSTQYFYRNTVLDGATFDYHADPKAILKGRAIFLGVFIVLDVLGGIMPPLGTVLLFMAMLCLPPFMLRALRFRMANTSYRGLRFGFEDDQDGAYAAFLGWPFLAALSLLLLGPKAHHRLKQFQHTNARFGSASFGFDASVGAFYRTYLIALCLAVPCLFVGFAVHHLIQSVAPELAADAAPFVSVVGYMMMLPAFEALMQNLVWSHTTLGEHRFVSKVHPVRLTWIAGLNLILIMVTCGLYYPFARVRTVRYRLESMTMLATHPLDTFVAGESQHDGALGDAVGDYIGVNIAG